MPDPHCEHTFYLLHAKRNVVSHPPSLSFIRSTARSHYVLSRNEIAKGIANRFVHSRTYIFLYLGLASLSVTTVVLSLLEGCPGLAFYILEIVVNSSMILEVGIRLLAFGRVSRLCGVLGGRNGTERRFLPSAAILEIPLQHCGLGSHPILCIDAARAGLCGLWRHFERRRNTRHASAGGTQCTPVRATGGCHAEVSPQDSIYVSRQQGFC